MNNIMVHALPRIFDQCLSQPLTYLKRLGDFPEFNNSSYAGRNKNKKRSLLIKQIEEDDSLTETAPEESSRREADHRLPPTPKGNVVFEGQQVKQDVNRRHEYSECEKVKVSIREDSLHLKLKHYFFRNRLSMRIKV